MKLILFKIDGQKLIVEKPNWESEELSGNTVIKWSHTVDSGYSELTGITNINTYGFDIGKDYKWVRDHIKSLIEQDAIDATLSEESDPSSITELTTGNTYVVSTGATGDFSGQTGNIAKWDGSDWIFQSKSERGFDLSTNNEKLILTEHKIGSHTQRVATVGFNNTVLLGLQYNARVTPVRQLRLGVAHGLVHNYLPTQAKNLFTTAWGAVQQVSVSYVFFGIEGTLIGDPSGMSDWIYGVGEFDGVGLLQQPWSPENGLTMQQLCDAAWDVIHNGNY